jgi:hypothetical protein
MEMVTSGYGYGDFWIRIWYLQDIDMDTIPYLDMVSYTVYMVLPTLDFWGF